MALLLSHKVLYAAIFSLGLLAIVTRLGIDGNSKAHSDVTVSRGMLHHCKSMGERMATNGHVAITFPAVFMESKADILCHGG